MKRSVVCHKTLKVIQNPLISHTISRCAMSRLCVIYLSIVGHDFQECSQALQTLPFHLCSPPTSRLQMVQQISVSFFLYRDIFCLKSSLVSFLFSFYLVTRSCSCQLSSSLICSTQSSCDKNAEYLDHELAADKGKRFKYLAI